MEAERQPPWAAVDRPFPGDASSVRRPQDEDQPTIDSTEAPPLDVADVSAAYERRVRNMDPSLYPLAMRTFERLPPERWVLEWHLPWWLGHGFHLSPETCRDLVLGNLLGLGSIRLQDDLADGEVAAQDVVAASALGAELFQAAIEPYRLRFPPASPFWRHFEVSIAAWRAAEGEDSGLAARGAPLKISAYAICLLAKRGDRYPAIDEMLDEALEALVRYDHVADWRADLEAGRWNAFVAALSPGPQISTEHVRHRREVLVAMMTTDAVTRHIGRVEAGLLRAADLAETVGTLPQLVGHLRGFARQAGDQGRDLQAHYRDLGERAASLLLDEPDDERS